MAQAFITRRFLLAAGLAAVLAAGVGYVLLRTEPSASRRLTDFRECARESGIQFRMVFLSSEQGENFKTNLYDHGCGVAIGDFDGDGYDDIYFLNQLGRNALYRNKGDGTFEDVTEKAGVGLGDRVCVGATFGDYDNSGRQSLFVTSTRGGNVLFRNMGDGTFKDVTREVGLKTTPTHSQTGLFFDYDNDGYLDLFVTNTARWTLASREPGAHFFRGSPDFFKMAQSPPESNILYHNEPDGKGGRHFVDVTRKAGLTGTAWSGDVAAFDFDGDGLIDLVVTNMFGKAHLYRNKGDGTFTDVCKGVLGRPSFGSIGCKVFDYDNDGRLDLLFVDMHSDMWLPKEVDPRTRPPETLRKKYSKLTGPFYMDAFERRYLDALKVQYDEVVFGNTLFHSLPGGKFEEVSDKANMETFWPWGIATGDFDNDGYEDVFLPSGMGYPYSYWPNALMMNNGNGTFSDRAEATGIEPPRGGIYLDEQIGGTPATRSSRCAAVADFDHSGRLSLVVNNFNDRPYYFRNHFPRKNYIAFRLEGTRSNRDAIGALVKIFLGKEVMVRQVHGAGGYLSQSSKTVHFGLGDRTKVDRVEIVWPSGDPTPQIIDQPALNEFHSVKESSQGRK